MRCIATPTTSINTKFKTMIKDNITIAEARKYISENYGAPRHDVSLLVRACRNTAKENEGFEPRDIFHLVIENLPIGNATHSYGFHTAMGRHLIESTINYYEYSKTN